MPTLNARLHAPCVLIGLVLAVATAVGACGKAPDESGDALVAGLSATDRLAFVTHREQGLELARRCEAERALTEFERALELCPGHPELLFHRARMLLRLGPADEAFAILEDLAAREPPMLPARVLLADLYGSPGSYRDEAKAQAMRAAVAAVCGELGDFEFELRRWLFEGGGPSPCARRARAPGATDPPPADDPLARLTHSYSRRFDMGAPARSWELDRDRSAEGELACRGVVEEYPGLAAVCAEEGLWLLKSQVRFEIVAHPEGPPMSSSVVLELGQQYLERASDASALDSPMGHFALLGLGHAARDMGDFDEAAQLYSVLLEQPGVSMKVQGEARFNLGVVLYRAGRIARAREPLRWCATRSKGPLLLWIAQLCGVVKLPLREEPVTDEHRRTLEFTDVAGELGVDKYDGAGSSAWADVDGDGDLDLFVGGCDTYSALYRNDGERFTDVSRASGLERVASGFSSTFADYDNDGDPDLYIGRDGWSGPAPNSLFRNRGDGTFEDVTEAAGVGNPGSSFVHGWADFDRDGRLDLFVAQGITQDGSTNVLYHNEGDGTFTDATASSGLAEPSGTQTIAFAIGDYDLDGWPDIFVNSWSTRNRLYHNRGDGTFEEVATAAGVDGRRHPVCGYVSFLEDFDGDGWPDLLFTKLSPFPWVFQGMLADYAPNRQTLFYATKFYRNRGDGTFVDLSETVGFTAPHGTMGANVGDVNNDGFLDLYLGTGDPMLARLEPNAFYLNEGGRRFVDLTRFTGLGHLGKGHGITFADYDFDGDLDIYAPQGGFVHGDLWRNAFYRNERGNVNHWLQVELVGTKSNRMGVGARLVLRAGDFVVYRVQSAGGAFGSSNSPFLHFGLGERTEIDRLDVAWPSGRNDVFEDVPVDRFVRLVEGAGELKLLTPVRKGAGDR